MKTTMTRGIAALMTGISLAFSVQAEGPSLSIAGMAVTPHVMADSMRYAQAAEPAVGARVQLFLRNDAASNSAPLALTGQTRVVLNGKSPSELLAAHALSWHDMPPATPGESAALPPGALTVWTFNGQAAPFGPGGRVCLEAGSEASPWIKKELSLDKPACWLSAVTFLGPDTALQPDTMVVHVANTSDASVEIRSCRLWLPQDPKTPRVLFAQAPLQSVEAFNNHAAIPAGDRGGFIARTGPLPLSYAAVEVTLARAGAADFAVWAYLRVKPEHFDISGGWVNPLAGEPYLKTLTRLHVNTAHLQITPGYSGTDLYHRYPLKYFGAMKPLETYDTDEMLPKLHAVEFWVNRSTAGGVPCPRRRSGRNCIPSPPPALRHR